MKQRTALLGLVSLVSVTGILWHAVAFAQAQTSTPSTGLALSPPTFEINGNPGDIIKNTVKLDNMNTYPVQIALDRRNFTAIGEEGAVGLTAEETSFSLASWIEVNPSTITLPPKSSQYFNFSIKVPLNAEPGGHFGSLIFRTIPTETVVGSGASLAQEIGSLILLRIAGETFETVQIEDFATSAKLYEFGPVNFVARLKNTGNVHSKPSSTITITNTIGQQVAYLTLDPKNILPGATRKIEGSWDTKWRFGRYVATFNTSFGDHDQRSSVSTFIIIPYRLLLVVLAILALLLFYFKKHQKRLSLAWKILKSGKA